MNLFSTRKIFLLHKEKSNDHSCNRFGTACKDNEKLIICRCNKCSGILKIVLYYISFQKGAYFIRIFFTRIHYLLSDSKHLLSGLTLCILLYDSRMVTVLQKLINCANNWTC